MCSKVDIINDILEITVNHTIYICGYMFYTSYTSRVSYSQKFKAQKGR